jgi:endonuclease
MKRFNVVIAREDGGVELHPLREWLRTHPESYPDGLNNANSNSHRLRDGLCRLGWSTQETDTEVRLIPPGSMAFDGAVEAVLGAGEDGSGEEEQSFATFELEYQLRDFLAHNLSTIRIGGKQLSLYIDPSGRSGVEFPTDVGPIDILAIDEQGTFVVFELKRARSPDHVIGQIARYMGWVKQKISMGSMVEGVIVAKAISQNLRYSIAVIPNVSLFEYEVKFELRPAQ